jgi:hypothetical protein
MAKQQKDRVLEGEILPPSEREVGVKLAGKVYVPALPGDAGIVQAHNGYMQWHNHALSLLDQYHAIREQYAANRTLIWRPSADVAAQEEEEAELKHQRKLAKLRRELEVHEHMLAALEAKHTLEAAEEFKEEKFELGHVRAAARRKDAEVEKSTAEAAIRKLAEQFQNPSKGNRSSLKEALDAMIRSLEQDVRQGDADGDDVADLHAALRTLEMLKGTL